MSTDERADDGSGEPVESDDEGGRGTLEQEAGRAAEQFDEGIVDLLAWVLDTETGARIYVYLRQTPGSTSEEIAEGTGLYPSTVREALAELHAEQRVQRRKRSASGAGNNPYEYTAIAPSDLVGAIVEDVQDELNTVFNLDAHLGLRAGERREPVDITVGDSYAAGENAAGENAAGERED